MFKLQNLTIIRKFENKGRGFFENSYYMFFIRQMKPIY